MQDVQTAVLELVTFTLKEIKRLNPNLDTEELTVENSIVSKESSPNNVAMVSILFLFL